MKVWHSFLVLSGDMVTVPFTQIERNRISFGYCNFFNLFSHMLHVLSIALCHIASINTVTFTLQRGVFF